MPSYSDLWGFDTLWDFPAGAIVHETQQRDLAHDPLFGAYSIVLNYSV
ncbi:MAG: hypothetical protein QNJ54_21840 [Prochloraceae cyanobacterium]|nr:hypothetical protein [Prochloraceae cyanobacterium]